MSNSILILLMLLGLIQSQNLNAIDDVNLGFHAIINYFQDSHRIMINNTKFTFQDDVIIYHHINY
jgi:predicted membrane-bound spermidine synthase